MLNTLSSLTYDPLGHVELDVTDDSSFGEATTRRVNRVMTLDGGVASNDGGFSSGDRTFQLSWRLSGRVEHTAVARLLKLYSRLVLSTRDGVFLVAPERYSPRVGTNEASLRLLVLEDLLL